MDESATWITQASAGLWNKVLAEDMDNYGDVDLIIGNHGQKFAYKSERISTHGNNVQRF